MTAFFDDALTTAPFVISTLTLIAVAAIRWAFRCDREDDDQDDDSNVTGSVLLQ